MTIKAELSTPKWTVQVQGVDWNPYVTIGLGRSSVWGGAGFIMLDRAEARELAYELLRITEEADE